MRLSGPVRYRARSVALNVHVQRAVAAMLVLALWQSCAARTDYAYYISSPLAIARQIVSWIATGFIWPHLIATIATTLEGFVLAAISGVVLAVAIGSSRLADKVLSPLIFVAYSTPKVVLAPMLILWIGVGRPPAIILAFVTGFFMVFFNVLSGIRAVSSAHLNLAAILGAGPLATALKFRVPAAAPFIATGLQQGLIYAFHGAILGEMTASNTGIGYVVVYAATGMDTTAVLAALCVMGAFSYVLIACLEKGVNRLTPAQAASERAQGVLT